MQSVVLVELEDLGHYERLCRVLEDVGLAPFLGKEPGANALFFGDVAEDSPERVIFTVTALTWAHRLRVKRIDAVQAAGREFLKPLPSPEEILLPLPALRKGAALRRPAPGRRDKSLAGTSKPFAQ